jgi:DNA polymerase (family 10)
MKNSEIAAIFYEMADILEIQDVAWKPRAYRQAARAIDTLPEDIEAVYKKGGIKLLEEIPGVGEGIAKKIIQYLETGKIKEHENLKKTVPKHITVLMEVPGIGPKKVKKLNKFLNIASVAQLKKAAKEHKIAKIPGFGEKSEQDILEGIAILGKSKGKILFKTAERVANKIINYMKKIKEVKQISAAGSLRRKRPAVRDIDILASSTKPDKVIDFFTKFPDIQKVLARGPTKATIILKSGIQSDLRVLPPESWGAGLFYFTGSKNYNIEMRKIAIKKGYKLSEYGLFDRQTNKLIAGKTEEEICKKLGVKYLKPEQREI